MKKKTEKTLILFFVLTTIGAYIPFTAVASEGWVESEGKWRYSDSQGAAVTSTWKSSNNLNYYLNSDGDMLTNSFVHDGNNLYYVDETGAMATNRWFYGKADEHDLKSSWYYFGSNGMAYHKTGNNFKKKIGDQTYAFDGTGKMLTGWIDKNGNSQNNANDAFVEAYFFAGEDGALYTNQWLNYEGAGGSGLFSELAGRSYEDYDNIWIYFGSNNKKVVSNGDRILQKQINGETYGFDEYGVMISSWSKVEVATPANGTPNVGDSSQNREERYTVTPVKHYSGYEGGRLFRNTWFWMSPSEILSPDDYENGEYSWWYADELGKAYTDRIAQVNGKRYAFDGIGRMRTGFVLFDGRSRFVGQYEVEAWSSKDFITGEVPGIEGGDLYLFSPDELNDGSMQIGSEVKVQLSNGLYTFGFGSDGRAIGNRNVLQRRNNSYYINGIRLGASEDFGYGVVKASDGSYSVVGVDGKIVKGSRKFVKDKDGNYLIILNDRFVTCVKADSAPRWHTGPEGTGYYYYDRENKENPYAGGLIAGYATTTDPTGLPEESCLNF